MITFIGIDKPINTACALKRDLKTVQTLYTSAYNATTRQVIITPNDLSQPNKEYPTLRFDDVAHIMYMHSPDATQCDFFSFAQFLAKNVSVTDTSYQAVIKPFIADLITEDINYQLLTIQIVDDNTLTIDIQDTEKVPSEEEMKAKLKNIG